MANYDNGAKILIILIAVTFIIYKLIGWFMGINNYRPEELTTQRKITSDAKNDTDDLVFKGDSNNGSRANAYRGVREFKDNLELSKLFDEAYSIDDIYDSL